MKTIIKNIPNDLLCGISTVLIYTFLLFVVRDVPSYLSYLFLLVASIFSITVFSPTIYLTPIYYIFSRVILLFVGNFERNFSMGGIILMLTYAPLDSYKNPFFTHHFVQQDMLSLFQKNITFFEKSFSNFQILPILQVLVVIISLIPFLFIKRETKSLLEEEKFRTPIYLFLFGALISIPSDFLLVFLILKGVTSVYILPDILFVFSIIPTFWLISKFFPNIKGIKIIFVPLISLFFFYLIITGGALLLFPFYLFEGLISMLIIAFPYFELPLLISGTFAYIRTKGGS